MGRTRRAASIAAFALASGLSGCFLIPPPKPFVQAVLARELNPVGAIVAPAAAGQLTISAPASITDAPDSPDRPPDEPALVRTDIQGQGDGSMKIEDRVVVTARSDIQHRAPNFSSEQAAAMTCASMKGGFNVDGAKAMHAATVKAEQARRDLDAGKITRKQADEIELARQDAVVNYLLPVPLLNMIVMPVEKKQDLPKPVFDTVRLENTDLFTFKENGRQVIAVSGVAHNTGARRVELPPVALRAIDEWDFAIAGQSSLLPFDALEPGEAKPFEVRFLNPPANAVEVYVHFSPPFLYRARRDCDFFDPSTFDPSAKLAASGVTTAALTGSKDYTAGELNQMTLFFRRESEAAWRCQFGGPAQCASDAQRLSWRDMYVLAEATDEAWVALAAAETAEHSGADVASAEKARARAMQRVRDLGAKALARAGTSVPGVAVAVSASTYGRDKDGLFVSISGTLTNAGERPVKVDALMVAFVDRLELPLASVAVPFDMVLAPGEAQSFSKRLAAASSRGTDGAQMGWGEKRDIAPARIPPRDIPWQVRVGAVAHGE